MAIVISPYSGLVLAMFTTKDNPTMMDLYVVPKMYLLCSLIFTLVTRILDPFVF